MTIVGELAFPHRPECDQMQPVKTFIGTRRGDLMAVCPGCRRTCVVTSAEDLAATPDPPAPTRRPRPAPSRAASTALVSRWRCREHPEEPVTWRGNGCAQCAQPARPTPQSELDPLNYQEA